MTRCMTGLAVGAAALFTLSAASQPPDGKGRGPGGKDKGPPGRMELGRVFPPFVREQLNLTPEQERQLADLERDVKARLETILTDEQKQQVQSMRPGGPGGDKDGKSRGGKGKGKGKSKGGDKGLPPGGPPQDQTAAGIQWFATWESGLAEATRSNRPILLVSAAPSCAGVSGIW